MSQWITIEAERVLRVSRGRDTILCDDHCSGSLTIVVKLNDQCADKLRAALVPMREGRSDGFARRSDRNGAKKNQSNWRTMAAFDVAGAAEAYWAKQSSKIWEYRWLEIEKEGA